jgi:hypothetical protein
MNLRESGGATGIECGLKVRFGLTGKSNDHVGREGWIVERAADPLAPIEE